MCDNPEHNHDDFDPLELIRETNDGQEVLAILVATTLALLADHAEKQFVSPPMSQLAEVVVAVAERIGNQDGIDLAKFVKITIDDVIATKWQMVEEDEETISWLYKGDDEELGEGA
jgi:hypothetical protein